MYGLGETEVEMARRQILAEEEMVARQRAVVERLPTSGEIAEIGRAYLAELEESLAAHRAQLVQLAIPSYSSPAGHPEQNRPESRGSNL